jgi:hypothetical protein
VHANGRGRARGRGHQGSIIIQQGEQQQEATLKTEVCISQVFAIISDCKGSFCHVAITL